MKEIKIKNINAGVPKNFASLKESADNNDLLVLIALLYNNAKSDIVVIDSEFVSSLDMDESDVAASIKFWCGAGLIQIAKTKKTKTNKKSNELKQDTSNNETKEKSKSENTKQQDKTDNTESDEVPKTKTKFESAHRDGKVEKCTGVAHYTTSELAKLLDSKRVTKEFVDEAMRITGKILTPNETAILCGLVDQFNYEEEAILAILAYSYKNGKKSIKYVEKLTLTLYDDGIVSTDEVYIKLFNLEKSKNVIYAIKKMHGFGERELTTKERKLFSNWVEVYGYGINEIRLAYDLTVDTIKSPSPSYANTIIEKWYANGLKTEKEIIAFIEKEKAEKNGKAGLESQTSSFKIDEFFEVAMNRDYEDL